MKSLYSAVLLFSALSLGACKNDDDTQNVTPSGPYTSLGAVFNANGAPSQTFNVDADTGGTFVAARGTRFFFPPRGFAYPNGDSNVHGTVQVTVQEFLDRGEFVFSRVLPVSGGVPLLSGGAFLTAAKQNNRAVQTRARAPYRVFMPQRDFPTDASLLQGYLGTQADSITTTVLWAPSVRPSVIASTATDTIAIQVDTVGYLQAAVPAPYFTDAGAQGSDATIKFNLGGPSGLNEGNSYLYVFPLGQRMVVPVGAFGDRLKKATYGSVKSREFNVVGVAVVNGFFYAGILKVSVEDGKTYTVNLIQAEPKTFKDLLTHI